MVDGLEIKGLDDWKKKMLKNANQDFPTLKRATLKRIAKIVEGQIKSLVPVDTGRLRNSFDSDLIDKDTAQVYTNVEYAKAVNNGFSIDQRFLPAKYLDTKNGRKYLKNGNKKGIMLHPQFVLGKHFMEKGIQNAEASVYNEIDNFINDMFKKMGD